MPPPLPSRWLRVAPLALTGMLLAGTVGAQAPVCSYQIVQSYPHDADAWTQGLLYHQGELFESTGLYMAPSSTLRRVEPTTGQVLQSIPVPNTCFAEGLALWQDELIQLTWQNQVAFVWDAATFEAVPPGTHSYDGEGWGLTHDGRRLIMSDGSSSLTFRDPETFAVLGSVQVLDDGVAQAYLNELEWIRGEVFANVWLTDDIVRIDPDTGEVIARIDLTGLEDPGWTGVDVLNGIAWDDAGERLFVTGKWWPSLFHVEMVGCPELRLFWDGFESGTVDRWSVSHPRALPEIP